jgi:hypothetical protein
MPATPGLTAATQLGVAGVTWEWGRRATDDGDFWTEHSDSVGWRRCRNSPKFDLNKVCPMLVTPKQFGCGLMAVGATLVLSVASAAEPVGAVARIQGSALINQGERYVPASEGMPVKEGDRMFATEGSSAVIRFNDGCQYTLDDTQILTIGATSTCTAGGVVATYPISPIPAAVPAGAGAGLVFAGVAGAVIGGAALVANHNNGNGHGGFPGPQGPTPLPPISP